MVPFSARLDGRAEGIACDVSNTQGETTQSTAGRAWSFSGQDRGHNEIAENKKPTSKEYPERWRQMVAGEPWSGAKMLEVSIKL